MKMKNQLPLVKTAVVLFAMMGMVAGAKAQCGTATFKFRSAGASAQKCNFEAFTDSPDSKGLRHIYLKKETQEAGSWNYDYGPLAFDTGGFNSDVKWSTAVSDCSVTLAGLNGSFNRSVEVCGILPPDETVATLVGDSTWLGVTTYSDGSTSTVGFSTYVPLEGGIWSTSTVTVQQASRTTDNELQAFNGPASDVVTETLTQEYSDGLLASTINGKINLPNQWSWGSPAASASFSVSKPDHYNGSGSKMEYQVAVGSSIKDAVYHCKWMEVTVTESSKNSVPQSGNVVGTGDPLNPALGGVKVVPVPSQPCTITEEHLVVESMDPPPSPPGNGGR